MLPILILNDTLELTPSGKAYVVNFENFRNGKLLRTWIPVAHSKIDEGSLWIDEWLLEPQRDGICALIRAGHKCLSGTVIIKDKIESVWSSKSVFQPAVITKGFFTVQGANEKHRTFRFKTSKTGRTLIGLMTGSNNIKDYTWFGFVDGDKIRFWKIPRYHQMASTLPISQEAIYEYFNAILGNIEESGKRYATYYKNCSRCGAVLTTPESLAAGRGPECRSIGY